MCPNAPKQVTTSKAAVNGIATFSNLILDTDGAYTLIATDGSLTATPASSSFNVTADVAKKLAFGQQPTNTKSGPAITPAVTPDPHEATTGRASPTWSPPLTR